MIGNVALGSDHPIKIQTMTTSDTKDVARTVEEVCLSATIYILMIDILLQIGTYCDSYISVVC